MTVRITVTVTVRSTVMVTARARVRVRVRVGVRVRVRVQPTRVALEPDRRNADSRLPNCTTWVGSPACCIGQTREDAENP